MIILRHFTRFLEDEGVKPVKRDEEKESDFIHEKDLESVVSTLWDELYSNPDVFAPHDKIYLRAVYRDLFTFDREDTFLLNIVPVTEYDLWLKAHNEHFLIIKLIGKISAYIEEPFNYIDDLYKPFSDDEKEKYMKKWRVK